MSSKPTSTTTPTQLLSPIFGNLIEVCIVTPNIHKTIDGLSPLGFGPFHIHKFNSQTTHSTTYKSAPASFELTVAFAQHGALTIELMQPDIGPSLMRDYLARNGGREGVQHIAFDMPAVAQTPTSGEDVGPTTTRKKMPTEERIRVMRDRGIEVAMSGVWKGKKGICEFVFFDTEDSAGTVMETIVFSEDWEEPEGVWYPCRPEELKGEKSIA